MEQKKKTKIATKIVLRAPMNIDQQSKNDDDRLNEWQ